MTDPAAGSGRPSCAALKAVGIVLAAVVRLLRNPGLTWRRQLQSLLAALVLFGLLQRVRHRAARIGAVAIANTLDLFRQLIHPPSAWAAP